MNLDLNKVQEAMDWLAEKAGGEQALKQLADSIEAFRGKIPTKLNNAEARYVLERLMSQRSLEGWDKKLEVPEVAGFSAQQFGAFFPQQHPGLSRATVPSQFAQNFRQLNYGFNVKFSIPGGRF